jgi:enolase
MKEFLIEDVHAREILDSRGNPTVEAEVILRSGACGRAAVPSGASTGSKEALELRDKDIHRFGGNGVRYSAVQSVNGEIRQNLTGKDVRNQRELDNFLIDLDGSADKSKSRLGANAILAVSLASAHAASHELKISLYRHIRQNLFAGIPADAGWLLPVPMMNFINGGVHANNALDFQEFMLVPHGATSIEEAIKWASEVYLCLLGKFRGKRVDFSDLNSYGVGDEGGFSIRTVAGKKPKDLLRFALDFLMAVVSEAGHSIGRDGDFAIALDPAASEFFFDGFYILGGKDKGSNPERLAPEEMMQFNKELVRDYPIVSIEDGMAETDELGWEMLTKELGERCQLVGDDLFVTNPKVFERGIAKGLANAVLVKVNQIGTLSEALDVVAMAKEHGYNAIVSHRSGETEDTTISDIAVAVNALQIKTGCLSRGDRVSKYNRLLRISQELRGDAGFWGRVATRRPSLRKIA